MELTREQAIKLHRELWGWLAENPMKNKYDWPKWDELGKMRHNCPCCEYVQYDWKVVACEKCPLEWKCLRDLSDPPCMCSYYRDWNNATAPEERSRLAAIIRDLPEKKKEVKATAPKFEIGQKVVPVSKTVPEHTYSIDEEQYWKQCKERGYFYIVAIDERKTKEFGKTVYECNMNKVDGYGNYYFESDLIPYVESPQTKFKVGDIVTGNAKNTYGITNTDMTKGEVMGVDGDKVDIKVLEHKKLGYVDEFVYPSLDDTAFELVTNEPTPEPKAFKVGDRVRVRTGLSTAKLYDGGCRFTPDMLNYCGKDAVITKSFKQDEKHNRYKLDVDSGSWSWTDRMLELVESPAINQCPEPYELTSSTTFKFKGNKTTCIIEIDGKKFVGVAKCAPTDEWNERHGRNWAELRATRKLLDAQERELRG